MTWPLPIPPHVSWRARARDWKVPVAPRYVPGTPPPDYRATPINVTRMFVGSCARDLEIDRMYYEYNNPPTTPQPPNLVWPAVDNSRIAS